MRFIIVGAGLSGLSCGVALAMRGHEVVIVERETEAGGLARTFRIDGYAFDYGPHYLFGPKVLPLLKEVLSPQLELMNVKRTKERMFFKGKYFKFPFEPKNLLLNMEPAETAGALFDLFVKRLGKGLPHKRVKHVEDWVIQSVGRRIYDYTSLGGYIENLYGLPPRQISEEWGIQKLKFLARLQDAGLLQLARRALGEEKKLAGQVVTYPSSGIDQLAKHIESRFVQNGGTLRFGCNAMVVEEKENNISLEFQENGGQERLECDFLVSTIPVTALLERIQPSPPEEIMRLAGSLRYRAALLLFLCIARDKVMDHQCVYFTDKDYPFRRITEFKNLDEKMAPEGKTSLCVEITCFEEEDIFARSRESLFDVVIKRLERGGYVKRDEVEACHLLRIPNAYPVYEIGHGEVLDRLLDYLCSFGKMISIGRQGLFFYNTMSNSVLSGYDLGRELAEKDRSGWRSLIWKAYRERKGKYH